MSLELVSILVLIVVFAIGTIRPVNMGALALVAAFVLGTTAVNETADDIVAGFPSDLFVILVGVTLMFAIATANGTVDWLVHTAVRMVRGRIALIPWVMFLVTATLTALGAVVPAAVAIIAPIGLGFARRYGINPLLMGLLIINGAGAGGFSPLAVWGVVTNEVVDGSGLSSSPFLLFMGAFLFGVLLSVVAFVLFGGMGLLNKRVSDYEEGTDGSAAESESGSVAGSGPAAGGTSGASGSGGASGAGGTATETEALPQVSTLDFHRILTLVGIIGLVVGALLDIDIGLLAVTVAMVLSVLAPSAVTKNTVNQVPWATVLLVCGIVTYVSLLQRIGTIDYLGDTVADIGAPLLAALLLCVIGGAVSAFASTTGIIGALIPLAVPFLLSGEVGAIGLIIAFAISSSVVDSSPFSTSGALVVANSHEEDRERTFRSLMRWGMSMIVLAPLSTWLILVVPGWG